MRLPDPALSIHPDRASVMHALASHVVHRARTSISERGRFSWALAGGSTPKELYELLASPEFAGQVEWSRVEVFWGDERCVPPNSSDSNYKMAHEALLSRVPVPPSSIHRMAGELTPAIAAERYNAELRRAFPDAQYPETPPSLDLILLGMGDDGHTASLFPGSPALQETRDWTRAVQKGEQWRLTLTFPILNAGREIAFLVTGAAKRTMLENVLNAKGDGCPWPSAGVRPTQGRVTWFVDREAAPQSSTGC